MSAEQQERQEQRQPSGPAPLIDPTPSAASSAEAASSRSSLSPFSSGDFAIHNPSSPRIVQHPNYNYPPAMLGPQQTVPQQHQMLQTVLPLPEQPVSTPWTLGSTDGSYAMSMLLLRQQQLQQSTAMTSATVATSTTAPVEEISVEVKRSPSQEEKESSPSPPVSVVNTGAAIAASTGQAAATSSSSASKNGNGCSHVTHQQHSIPTSRNSDVDEIQHLISLLNAKQSLVQDRLFRQSSSAVEAVLAASCEVMGFDIAELWLRTGPKTHQLTNSHLRPTALEDSARRDLVDVYYGEKSSERTHRVSPALCKRAKEAGDVVWVTAHSAAGAEALRYSISNVRTAVAVPICHEATNTNVTIIFFSMRRMMVRPPSVEFLVHMSLAAGVTAISGLEEDELGERARPEGGVPTREAIAGTAPVTSMSEHIPNRVNHLPLIRHDFKVRPVPTEGHSVTGARLDLQWRQLANVEYLTDGGNSWIHTAVFDGKPVVVKTLKPECQDVALAINEIEGELLVHARLNHSNIVSLLGAGTTSKGVRFVVLERLDGGTLTQRLGYDTRIRDRRRRFWRKKQFSYLDVLRIARSIAEAMAYCNEEAIPNCVVMHRDLKPDNIGFTLDGTVKLLDFGLAKVVENASVDSDEVFSMSGETGSLRYMAPEVADGLPYNASSDVYSFGIILWELNALKKPFEGLNRDLFYERVVHGGERPHLSRKWPAELTSLMSECWDADMQKRPRFREIVKQLDSLLTKEKGGSKPSVTRKQFLPKISGMIDRHSTWF